MTDEEWQRLYENFETMWLLSAVDDIDNLRGYLGDGPNFEPPEIRTDLLKLHQLAMDVVNNGWTSALPELRELADDLEVQTSEMMDILEKVQKVLQKLNHLLPKDHSNEDDDDDDDDDD